MTMVQKCEFSTAPPVGPRRKIQVAVSERAACSQDAYRQMPRVHRSQTAVGPLIDGLELKMITHNAANVTWFPKCATKSMNLWVEELTRGDVDFYRQRPEFVSDTGYVLMKAREASMISRKELALRTGLARATIYEIESGHRIGGSTLGKVATYLSGCNGGTILFTLKSHDSERVFTRKFSADSDAVLFCADLVRSLRNAASLTQAELNHLIRLPTAIEQPDFCAETYKRNWPSAAPQISIIENPKGNGSQRKSNRTLRLGTLFAIAFFCGFTMGVTPNSASLKSI